MPRTKKPYKIGSRCDLAKKETGSDNDRRLYVLVIFFILITSAVICKLYTLQVTAYESYKALADDQHSLFQKLIPKRGEIFLSDKSGPYPVAVNKDTKMAYAVPKEIEDPAMTSIKIASILGLDTNEMLGRFSNPDDMYEVLKHKLSDDEIAKINDAKLKGIHLADESYRYYA